MLVKHAQPHARLQLARTVVIVLATANASPVIMVKVVNVKIALPPVKMVARVIVTVLAAVQLGLRDPIAHVKHVLLDVPTRLGPLDVDATVSVHANLDSLAAIVNAQLARRIVKTVDHALAMELVHVLPDFKEQIVHAKHVRNLAMSKERKSAAATTNVFVRQVSMAILVNFAIAPNHA